MFDNEMQAIFDENIASTTTIYYCLPLRKFAQNFLRTSKSLFNKTSSKPIGAYLNAHPQHMRVVKQFNVFDNEVGGILDGSIASISSLRCCLPLGRYPPC